MKTRNRAEIWKQQKYNNSCAWDCFSMLLKTQGVETSSLELVGSSHIPYQIRLHPEENRLSAGMLVQADRNVNAVLGRFGFQLNSRKAQTIADYIDRAKDTLLNGDAFITNIKRPGSLPGRHAIVVTEFRDPFFLGLDPDYQLDRTSSYSYADVEETVDLRFTLDEFVSAVSGEDDFIPLLGILSPYSPGEPESAIVQDIFNNSKKALEFYVSETRDFDFRAAECISMVYSVLKPIVSDLRTAIEIQDEYTNRKSEISSFLQKFEIKILQYRKLLKNGKAIPEEVLTGLRDSLTDSYSFLEKHLSYEAYVKKMEALTTA